LLEAVESTLRAFSRALKNKHQAVSQGVRRFGKHSPSAADEHLQKPHNAGSRPYSRFFNTLLGFYFGSVG
jgi:hypothetical protein